ncbi:unnamed protein product [Acanthoscelides obtectus]|uniref:Uncharacterized protein n=1 Tax=Acanthoscelides obtectus TaxID=200917 RepID=A0A9P0Q9W0_ACAOB|nr:unnamed protein product [Acanthoscelides obtectus]CAK1627193.1 hypothetical protein AOBTE_LOCUS4376 [Acanthoscelides obtectus]
MCMYLSNTDSVDKIITEHKSIKVQDHDIEIRRLVTPAQRLVISNVCPSVPNNIIESSLTTMGLKLLSRITYLRVGMPENEYNHILSFRRQVYIAPPVSEIIDSTTITFEETTYMIFFSVDGPSCTLCKQTGHTLEKCPKSQSRNEDTETRMELESSNVHNKTNTLSLNMTATIQDNSVSEETRPKRQISTSPVSTNTQPTLTEAPTKRIKTSKVSEEPAEGFINSRFTSTKLNVSEVADMIENTYKSKDIIATFRNYTNNIPDMNQMWYLEAAFKIVHIVATIQDTNNQSYHKLVRLSFSREAILYSIASLNFLASKGLSRSMVPRSCNTFPSGLKTASHSFCYAGGTTKYMELQHSDTQRSVRLETDGEGDIDIDSSDEDSEDIDDNDKDHQIFFYIQ